MEKHGILSEASKTSEGTRHRSSSKGSVKESRWDDWPEALSRVRELPARSQFPQADRTWLETLQALVEFFALQEEPYPSIAKYVKDRLDAPPFLYISLRSQPPYIRLLRFNLDSPNLSSLGERSLMVELHLESFPVDDCPEYNALSYVWGNPTVKVPVSVNGRSFSVTDNLQIILSHLRQQRYKEWIWIDAICIDQSNVSEKSAIVKQIPFIYQHAKTTMAWLGTIVDSVDGTDKDALLGVARIKKMIDEIVASPEFNQTYLGDLAYPVASVDQISPEKFRMMLYVNEDMIKHFMRRLGEMLSGDKKKYITQLSKVLTHTLWRRIWIVQEFAQSRDLRLVTEKHTMSLQNIFYIWAILFHAIHLDLEFDPHLLSPAITGRIKMITPMVNLPKALFGDSESLVLLALLGGTGWFEASDSRDKIFALMGLAKDAPHLAIDINYELEYESLCKIVSVAFLQEYGVLTFSFNAGWTEDRAQSNMRLPSWCSDWRLGSTSTILGRRPPEIDLFTAGLKADNHRWGWDLENGRLSIFAMLVDNIRDVRACDVLQFDNDRSLLLVQVWSKLTELFSGISSLQVPSKGAYLNEALYCVPIAYGRSARDPLLPYSQKNIQQPHDFYRALHKEHSEASKSPCDHQPSLLMKSFRNDILDMAGGRSFIATESGWLGLGPPATQAGDILCIFPNANVPHIIRPLENGHYLLIGEAYVHGIMHGEYFEHDKKPEMEEIILE